MITKQRLTLGPVARRMELSHEEFAEADFLEPYRDERVHGRLVDKSPSGDIMSRQPVRF